MAVGAFTTAVFLFTTPLALHVGQPGADEAHVAPRELIHVVVRGWSGPESSDGFLRRVDEDGFISLPWAGEVKVGGLSRDEADRVIEQAYVQNAPDPARAVRTRSTTVVAAPPKPGPAEAGDTIYVQIWDVMGPGLQIRLIETIRDDGTLKLPFVDVPVKGLSDHEIAIAIAEAYRDKEIVEAAQVLAVRLSDAEADLIRPRQP